MLFKHIFYHEKPKNDDFMNGFFERKSFLNSKRMRVIIKNVCIFSLLEKINKLGFSQQVIMKLVIKRSLIFDKIGKNVALFLNRPRNHNLLNIN